MKIIQIMDSLGVAGGVNSFVYDLCIALKDAGQDVTLIGIIGDESKAKSQAMAVREAGIQVHCLCMPGKKQAIATGIPKLRKLIKEIGGREQTICNLHLKLSVLMGGLATIGMQNVKCVETYHSQYSHYNFEYSLMKGRICKYIPCSESAGKEMQTRFHVPVQKLQVIPNGIDSSGLRRIAGKKEIHEGVRILSVGRMTKQKNYPVSVEAFREICNDSIVYQIIGEGEDKKTLISLAQGNTGVQFLGIMSREKVVKYTNNADLILMPSLWEGLSIYLLEAMSLGKPLMLSNIPSFTGIVGEELLKDGESWRCCSWGYLVETSSVEAYKEAVQHYLLNKKMWSDMGKASERIAQGYDIHKTAEQYVATYLSVLK